MLKIITLIKGKILMIVVLLCLIVVVFLTSYIFLIPIVRLNALVGNYQQIGAEAGNNIFHLYIGSHLNEKRYFTIYDNGGKITNSEKPWIQGKIESVDSKKIIVKLDEEVFDLIPFEWKISNSRLILTYKVKKDVITLTNEGVSLFFEKQQYYTNKLN